MRSLLRRVRSLKRGMMLSRNPFLSRFGPGHFYSPIPGPDDLDGKGSDRLGPKTTTVPGVMLNVEGQLALLEELGRLASEQPFPADPTPPRRYYYKNDMFCFQDAVMLYGILRHLRPRQIIEVGSGYSSAAMLDVDELFLDESVRFTFIEPFPNRLHGLMRQADRDRHRILITPVQTVPLETFDELCADDILFIDSSHVGKVGSDVLFLLTEVVPRLKPGVIVHFHDIFWPFEYPSVWFDEGRAWNEGYLVRAFLQFNERFRLLLFNDYIAMHHPDRLRDRFPLALAESGGSLWLQRAGGVGGA
jgi:predicted O-methyltransferase YrrM